MRDTIDDLNSLLATTEAPTTEAITESAQDSDTSGISSSGDTALAVKNSKLKTSTLLVIVGLAVVIIGGAVAVIAAVVHKSKKNKQ